MEAHSQTLKRFRKGAPLAPSLLRGHLEGGDVDNADGGLPKRR